MLKRYATVILIVTIGLALVVACGRRRREGKGKEEGSGQAKAKYTPKGNEGTVNGKVMFEGTPPAFDPLDMTQDSFCSSNGSKTPDNVVIKDGKLKNVFVYVKGAGVDNFSFDAGGPVTLDQRGCRYEPRVLGVMVGQTLKVLNSDSTGHNIHPSPKFNPDVNKAQAANAPPIDLTFRNVETLIPVKCNQHPWMKSNVGVLNHPCFAVSGDDGSYSITGVPPGDYTLVFWHEVFGEQSQNIKVAANGTVTQDFTYKAGAGAKPATFLRVEPVLMLP
jgi:plastocyanin